MAFVNANLYLWRSFEYSRRVIVMIGFSASYEIGASMEYEPKSI